MQARAGQLALWTSLSAALYALAFPPAALVPLAWVALVPLLCALARTGVAGGLLLGLSWSLLVGLATSWWLPAMVRDYFDAGALGGWAVAAAATLWTGLFYGLFGGAWAWLARRRVPGPLATALLWGACEYGRTVAPLANPWVLSGYSQTPFTPLVQMADVTGVVGIGMLLAAANAAVAGALDPALRGRRPRLALAATALAVAAALVYGGLRLGTRFEQGEPLRVALVQSAVPRAQRFEPRFRGRNLAQQVDLLGEAARSRPDLVFLPELALDVPLEAGSLEGRTLARVAGASGADLFVGAPARDVESGRAHNSFFLLRGGEIRDRYDKVALTYFSETNPLRGFLDVGLDPYAPGRTREPLRAQGAEVGVLLCGEAMLGGFARQAVRAGARLLVNPANDSWFGSAAAARMQLDVARMRAVETRRPLLRPTMTGLTAVVDPHGRVVSEAPAGRAAVLEARVAPATGLSPYVRFGDWAGRTALAGALGLVVSALVAGRRAGSGAASGAASRTPGPTRRADAQAERGRRSDDAGGRGAADAV